MVRDAILGEIVRSDFLGAVAGFDLSAAFGSKLLVLLFLLHFVEAGAENAHGLRAILDLRFFVLLRDDETARDMRNAHGRVRSVHRLPAGSGGAERIDAQIFG